MRRIIFTGFILTALVAEFIFAQITFQSYYDFAVSSGSYQTISDGTVILTNGVDDQGYTNGGNGITGPGYPIGFTLYFNGEYFTRFGVSSNGFIGLGTEAEGVNLSSNALSPLEHTGTIMPAKLRNRISPFGADLASSSLSDPPAISYKLSGDAPNRVMIIQFKEFGRWGLGASGDNLNFQIRLYETTHKVEVIYGQMSSLITQITPIGVGLGGTSSADHFALTSASNWMAPAYATLSSEKMIFSNTIRPASGTTYTWTLRLMAFSSSTTEQASTTSVLKEATNQPVVKLRINTTGWVIPFSVTSITFTTNGTTNVADLSSAKVYYTMTDAFSAATQFGSAIINPSGNLVFTGAQQLGNTGNHYFWLAYDISASAITNNFIDGTCTGYVTNEGGTTNRTPDATTPAGNRQIISALSGTITVGEGGNYPNLTRYNGLFAAINSLGLAGNLTVNIISDISEDGTNLLNQWTESGGSGYTLTIQPADATLRTIYGSCTNGLIRFNGSDRVTINGNFSGSGQYLKFRNTSTSSAAHSVYFYNGSTNISIKNCIIEGSGNSVGVVHFAHASNQNNLIEGCTIKDSDAKPSHGIYFEIDGNNNIIRNCSVYDFLQRGIYIYGQGNTVENCNIYMTSNTIYDAYGIYVSSPGATTQENKISKNKIYGLNSATSGVTGINCYILSGTTTISNNVIALSPSTTGIVKGINILYADAVLSFYYNSIYIGGSLTSGSSKSSGIYKEAAVTTFNVKNNSVYNARSNSGGSGSHYAIYFANTATTSIAMNYNDYYVSGTGGVLGYWTTDKTTLADWRTASTQDNNSINGNPLYVSSSNLKPFNTSPLISTGTPVAGITTDFEGGARNGTAPNIGAYETTQTPVTVDFCNLQTGNTTIREGQAPVFYARVFKDGVTNAAGQGAGIECWIGYNTSNTDPSTWSNWIQASYTGDAETRDEYMATLPSSLTPGTYRIASRFFITNSMGYQYGGYSADGGGFWDNVNNISSELTINDNSVTFANVVNSPVNVKLGVNKQFVARYYLQDVTSQSSACSAVQVWIGYNSSNTNPSGWSNWVLASYSGQSGGNHEYVASFGSTFNVGTYYYASRIKLNEDGYVYGGYSSGGGGIYNGTSNVNGQISVNAELPLFENFDNVTAPAMPQGWTVQNLGTGTPWGNQITNYLSSPNALTSQNPYTYTYADAWLFSPPLNLTGGITYKVTFYYKASGTTTYAKLKGQYGTSASKSGMITGDIFNYTTIAGSYVKGAGTFTPATSGTYYVGWQNYSNYEGPTCYVHLDDIQIYPAPLNTSSQTIGINNTSLWQFGATGIWIKFDVGNSSSLTVNIDEINSAPGTNGSLPAGINNVVSKYWNIGLTSGSVTTGYYSISIDITGISGINDPKNIYLLKRNNSNNEWQNLGKPVSIEGNILTWSGLNSFSEFTLGGDSENPLPVELTSFTAEAIDNAVLLRWQTVNEVNNNGFYVEKRVKSLSNWETLGFVTGSGNSNSPKEYSYIDKISVIGSVRYRLKQIDNNGNFTYSNEIETDNLKPSEFGLSQNYPNPFNPSTKIKYQLPTTSSVLIELYSITGEKVAKLIEDRLEAGNYSFEINTGSLGLSSGVYFCRMTAAGISNKENFIKTLKIIVLK